MAGDISGEPVILRGRVLAPAGAPIPNARLDVWQSDAEGLYDLQMEGVEGAALRGIFHTDSEGKYNFRTIKPSFYPIPDDGPVGEMLKAMGRHPHRPAHIHFIISADGYQPVTTELFVDDDPYLDSDAVFGVRESLVVPLVRDDSEDEARQFEVSVPFYTVDYDFVLEPV
jgi:catechol 1,2-dioxygenase